MAKQRTKGQTVIYKALHIKPKNEPHGGTEGLAVPAPLVTTVVLL